MAKRRNFAKRCCRKCGGRVGVIKRDLSLPKRSRMDLLGCVEGLHLNWSGTTGYDLFDFPMKESHADPLKGVRPR